MYPSIFIFISRHISYSSPAISIFWNWSLERHLSIFWRHGELYKLSENHIFLSWSLLSLSLRFKFTSVTDIFIQVVAQKFKEAEITEQDSRLLVSSFETYYILLINSCVLEMDLKFLLRIIVAKDSWTWICLFALLLNVARSLLVKLIHLVS